MFGGGSFAHEHEAPGAPDFPGDAKRPTEFDITNGFLRHVQRVGRFRGVGDATVVRLNYDHTDTFSGTDTSNTERDRTVYSGGYRLGYEFLPHYEGYVRGEGNWRDYDDAEQSAPPGSPARLKALPPLPASLSISAGLSSATSTPATLPSTTMTSMTSTGSPPAGR